MARHGARLVMDANTHKSCLSQLGWAIPSPTLARLSEGRGWEWKWKKWVKAHFLDGAISRRWGEGKRTSTAMHSNDVITENNKQTNTGSTRLAHFPPDLLHQIEMIIQTCQRNKKMKPLDNWALSNVFPLTVLNADEWRKETTVERKSGKLIIDAPVYGTPPPQVHVLCMN